MRITTANGWLESLQASHANALFEVIHASRSHLYPWLPWLKRIHSPEDTRAFIVKLIKERGPQFVVIVDGRLCGGVGYYWIDKDQRSASIGYWLGQEFTGHGIMRDAIIALCHYGFNELALHKVEIRCAADNAASRRLPESLGFYFEGVKAKAEWLTDRYVDHAIYSILADEFIISHAQVIEPHTEFKPLS